MSRTLQNTTKTAATNVDLQGWFETLIEDIKVDQFMMEQDVAPTHKKDFYTAASQGDERKVNSMIRVSSSMYFLKGLIAEYFEELSKRNKWPLDLAMSLSDSKILVWAQINDEDYETEKALMLSEAKANSKYFDDGFYITSTIVEKGDELPIPTDYSLVQLKTK
ncbi:MAG TPA: hypothetical protein VEB40_13725 [Flavipsychrobacter sp.]|nr:hypothetical protein [Flavipsychrobacter sp.]